MPKPHSSDTGSRINGQVRSSTHLSGYGVSDHSTDGSIRWQKTLQTTPNSSCNALKSARTAPLSRAPDLCADGVQRLCLGPSRVLHRCSSTQLHRVRTVRRWHHSRGQSGNHARSLRRWMFWDSWGSYIRRTRASSHHWSAERLPAASDRTLPHLDLYMICSIGPIC